MAKADRGARADQVDRSEVPENQSVADSGIFEFVETATDYEDEVKISGDSPRDVSSSDRFWRRAERATRVAAGFAGAVAALIAALQYTQAYDIQRSERSLDFAREWQRRGLDGDFATVQVFVEERLTPIKPALDQLDSVAQQIALKNLARRWLLENREQIARSQPSDVVAVQASSLLQADPSPSVEIEGSIDNLVQFFSQMQICIKAEICDEDVLQQYFASEVISFWSYFSSYAVLRQEAGYTAYGAAVDRLVARFEGEQP